MSIEQALIARAVPRLIEGRLAVVSNVEATKGCLPYLAPHPVELEPPYRSLVGFARNPGVESDDTPFPAGPEPPLHRLRLWVSPEQKLDWLASESFVKQLAGLTHRVGFEIIGNKEDVHARLVCAEADARSIISVFKGLFDQCAITRIEDVVPETYDWQTLQFREFYPPPPYSHLLTGPEELKKGPFNTFLTALASIEEPGIGFYQCMFQSAQDIHDWHTNVETLQDIEYSMRLWNGDQIFQRYEQQLPSGDRNIMAREVDQKAHNDKPFFFACVRVGVLGAPVRNHTRLEALCRFVRMFQHGGRPLSWLSHNEYREVLSTAQTRNMIRCGVTYRPGFLVNSNELAGLVTLFPADTLKDQGVKFEALETLPFRIGDVEPEDTCIGTCKYADSETDVRIPTKIRTQSTHVIGGSGSGKSTLLEHMFCQDIERGHGAVFIDAHGDTVRRLLRLVPPELRGKCIYFNPGDPEWIPLWNPLVLPQGGDMYRLVDDILSALRRVIGDWGHRLEHVLRNGLIGLEYLQGSNLLDLLDLVNKNSERGELLRSRIANIAIDEPVRTFWAKDFKNYNKTDVQAPQHKLSKLLTAGSASLMLSQSESRIDLRRIMDEGMIMFIDLSLLGTDVKCILGAFLLTLFLTTATGRSDIEVGDRSKFAIYADEAQLFVSADAIEKIITEARKFGLNLCLSHQYLKQFNVGKIDALSTVGCSIIGRVDRHDSQYFSKDLRGLVEPNDILALEEYQMLARIGRDVVRFRAKKPEGIPPGADAAATQIMEESRRKYCRRAVEVRSLIRNRGRETTPPNSRSISAACRFTEEELRYDEF